MTRYFRVEDDMALATLHIAAIPVIAGLLAGTGAIATYQAPAEPAPAAQSLQGAASVPCAEQAWPTIDRACLSADPQQAERQVRVVTAPRRADLFDVRWDNATSQGLLAPAFPGMTTHDGVLRGPQKVIDAAPETAAPPPRIKRSARAERKRTDPRAAVRTYTVPAEDGGEMRQVYVVRPQRIEFFQ